MIASVLRPRSSAPSNLIDPLMRQATLLVMHPSSVDFPAPFDPRSDTICPRSTESVTSASAAIEPYLADRPAISSMSGLIAQIGLDNCRRTSDFSGRAFANFFAVIEYYNLITHGHDHAHIVLDQQHGDAVLIAQVPHGPGDAPAFLRVHPCRRLIE